MFVQKDAQPHPLKYASETLFSASEKGHTNTSRADCVKSSSRAMAGRKAGRLRGEILVSLLSYFTLACAFKCRDLRQIGDRPCFQACCARGEVFQTAGPGRSIGKEIKIPFHPPGQRCCASNIPP